MSFKVDGLVELFRWCYFSLAPKKSNLEVLNQAESKLKKLNLT